MSLQHPDKLIVRTLTPPILDDYFGSANQKADVKDVAEEIKRRYVALVPKESGRLAATARVVMRRSLTMPDGRYDAEFLVGGGSVDYADDVEREHHILARVLREMGLAHGDIVDGPTGRIAAEDRAPATEKSKDEVVQERRIYEMTDAEIRQRNLEGHNRASARSGPDMSQEDRDAASRSALDLEISGAADRLLNARPGSAASAKKYQELDTLNRFHLYETGGQRSGTAENAMATHNLFRERAGLEHLPRTPDLPSGFDDED